MIVGAVVSLTVTLKVQFAVLPDPSLAVQVTTVMPLAKVEPDGGLHEAAEPGQLSPTVGAG